jgi:hypothetical protein
MALKTRTASNINPGRLGGNFHWPDTALCFFYPTLSSLRPFYLPFLFFFRLSRTTETLKTRTASNINPGRLESNFHWPDQAPFFFSPSLSSLFPLFSSLSLFSRLSRTTETLKKTELRAI